MGAGVWRGLGLWGLAGWAVAAGAAVPAQAPATPEGLRFACAGPERAQIGVAMRAYWRELGLSEALVDVVEHPDGGTLTYTLRTAADDRSTLDFAHRPAYWVRSVEVRLPTPTGRWRVVQTVSEKEVLLALLQRGRLTVLAGAACSVQALREHIALRQNLVAWAERNAWVWPDGAAARWNARLWRGGAPRPGVPLPVAVADVFGRPQAYALGCYTLAKLVVSQGVLDYLGRVRRDRVAQAQVVRRLQADGQPLVGVEPGAMWAFEPGHNPSDDAQPGKLLKLLRGVAPRNFVPGDWVYFYNTDPVSWQKTGYEGSNAIYLGRGLFSDYYNDNGHAYTFEQKLDEVYQWRHGVFSRSRDHERARRLSSGELEALGQSPERGGLLWPVRAVPYVFGHEALPPLAPGDGVARAGACLSACACAPGRGLATGRP